MCKIKNCFVDEKPQKQDLNLALQIHNVSAGNIYDFYLPMEIEDDTTDYIDFFRCVRSADSKDTVNLHINCYGGSLQVAYNIIDVLRESQANIEIYLEGGCCSAASMIALAGDTWRVSEHAYMMIHAWSGYRYGKWNEQQASFQFDETWLEKSFRKTYKDFLTEEEISEVLSGKDMYLDSEEIQERLLRFQEKARKQQQILNEITQRYENEINIEIQKALQAFNKEETKTVKVGKNSKRVKKEANK